jgi:hypothetical protein
MSTNKLIDVDLLEYYDSKTRIREDAKINSIPFANSMEYVKWYFDVHRDGKIYGVKFAYDANDCLVATGTKYGANTNLVAQPSTRTVSGRNDYDEITVFKHFDANAHLDDNGNTIIDAIYGDKNFSYTGKVDVVCVFAPVYEKIYVGYESTTKYLYIEWCDTPRPGFTLNKLCKDGNGNNKGFYCITKFQAGLIEGTPYSSAGLYPWVKSADDDGPCYNTCVDVYHDRHNYMCGMTMAEWAMIQRIFLMKYSSTNQQMGIGGLSAYYYTGYAIQYTTSNKNYIVLKTTDATTLYLNTMIDVGTGNSRGPNQYNIICNTEILSMNNDIVIFNDLTTTGFIITDASYSLVSIPTDILCTKLAETGEAKTVEDDSITATFNNGSDVTVNLVLDVTGTTYTLYAYDGSNNEIGHSTAGDTTNTVIYISDIISTAVGSNYVETSIYKTGYSLEICGDDGCWEIGNFVNDYKHPSVISGIEIHSGAWDLIGNAIWNYDSNTNPHIELCNNPSLISKSGTHITNRYIDIGNYTHTNSESGYVYGSDIRYDLINGGFVIDCGNGADTKGVCDATYILGNATSGRYEMFIFGTLSRSRRSAGLFCASAGSALSASSWGITSRPSLNGVMG